MNPAVRFDLLKTRLRWVKNERNFGQNEELDADYS